MLTPEQDKKVEIAYERFRWAAKEAERLFDLPLVVRYSGGKDSDPIDVAVIAFLLALVVGYGSFFESGYADPDDIIGI